MPPPFRWRVLAALPAAMPRHSALLRAAPRDAGA